MSRSFRLIGAAVLMVASIGCQTTVVTDRWENGSPKRTAAVQGSDTLEIRTFESSGQLTKITRWKDGTRHGKWEAFYPDGTPWSLHHYQNGTQVGSYQTWHPNGQPFISGAYNATGQATGVWTFFNEQGEKIAEKPGSTIHNGR